MTNEVNKCTILSTHFTKRGAQDHYTLGFDTQVLRSEVEFRGGGAKWVSHIVGLGESL